MDAAKRLWLGVLMAVIGGYLAVTSVVSSAIRFSRHRALISQVNAPIQFGLLVCGSLAWSLAKFCFVSAVPFGVMAYFDRTWRSRDAAPVALGAWAAVFWFFALRFGAGCPPTAALLFAPLVFSALVAHAVGTLRHPADAIEGA